MNEHVYKLNVEGLSQGTNRKNILMHIADDGCFYCLSHTVGSDGYPQIYHNGRVTSIARMLMETRYGRKLPYEICALHKCNNKLCINPDHIRIGTRSENTLDSRDTMTIGGQKLCNADVTIICSMWETGKFTQQEIGDLVGVRQDHISRIVNNKAWRCDSE
jgi:predicted XRE-type DNA-binding protein